MTRNPRPAGDLPNRRPARQPWPCTDQPINARTGSSVRSHHARHCRGWGGPAADEPCVRWAAAGLGIQPEVLVREAERIMAGPKDGG